MIVVNICITNPYVDGWGYQENLLAKYMHLANEEVHVVAPLHCLPSYVSDEEANLIHQKGNDYEIDGVRIHRIRVLPISESLIIPHGLFSLLKAIKPDVIFHHNINSSEENTEFITETVVPAEHVICLSYDNALIACMITGCDFLLN